LLFKSRAFIPRSFDNLGILDIANVLGASRYLLPQNLASTLVRRQFAGKATHSVQAFGDCADKANRFLMPAMASDCNEPRILLAHCTVMGFGLCFFLVEICIRHVEEAADASVAIVVVSIVVVNHEGFLSIASAAWTQRKFFFDGVDAASGAF